MSSPSSRAVVAALVMLATADPLVVTAAGPSTWVDQTYRRAPVDNPLKGLLPFQGRYNNFPHSMEWNYVAWKDIQTDYETFRWEPMDQLLEDVAARGHQTVFRIYADYPDRPYALPAFLSDVPKHAYTDHQNGVRATSYSPDYDDDRLLRALTSIIRALGQRYDGDARIAFITVGFIGFYGEWQTYRPSCSCDEWMPSRKTQAKVLGAFDKAFARTKLLLRYPDVGWRGQRIGFHDDSFADHTIGAPPWMFLNRLKSAKATNRWEKQPIGGELSPVLQPCAFREPPCTTPDQNFDAAVTATHASWLIDHFAFEKGYTGDDYGRAVDSAARLGYELFVSSVRLRDSTTRDNLEIDLEMQNRGVAPFYYDWTVQLGIASAGRLVTAFNTGWKLSRVKATGADTAFRHVQRRHGLGARTYTLLLRVVNPMTGGKPVAFANETWGQDLSGWLTLGTIDVAPQ